MTQDASPELPESGMATGNDEEIGTPPGPLDAEEQAVLEELRRTSGEDVVGVAEEERPEYARAVVDETPLPE
jgi:hypothetical protein